MSDDLDSALDCYAGVALGWIDRFEPEGTDVRAKAGEARVLYELGRINELRSLWESAKRGFERGWPLGASLRAEIEGYALIADGRVDGGAASLLDAARTSKERFRAAYLKATAGLAKADRDLINTAICELDEMGAQIASESIRRKARGIGLRPRHRPRSKLAVTGSDVRIASLIRAGKTNAEIGAQLGLSTKTVEHYVSNMLSKLGLRSRAQLAATIGSDSE
jgi:DNA-binding NarL/FixJ family response regulator